MQDRPGNPLSTVERRKTNFPLLIAAVLTFLVLAAGVVVSIRSGDWAATGLFLIAAGMFAIAVLLDVAKTRRLEAMDDRKFIHWDAAMPELQRQNVNVEVRELAKLLSVGDDQLSDLLSAYIVAEDLALRQIQQEENRPLMRHVSIGKVPFDGILVDQDLITCIEVSFLVVPDVRQDKVEAMQKKIAQAKRNLAQMKSRLRVRLMIVLVTQLTEDELDDLRNNLVKRRFNDMQIDSAEIRFLDFELLQKLYLAS